MCLVKDMVIQEGNVSIDAALHLPDKELVKGWVAGCHGMMSSKDSLKQKELGRT